MVPDKINDTMVTEKTWQEFQAAGLVFFVNQILHFFGWALVMEYESDELIRCYPARVKFRGFSEKSIDRGYKNVAAYLAANAEELRKETFEEE